MREIADLENKIKQITKNLKGIFSASDSIHTIGKQIHNEKLIRYANIIKTECHLIVNLLTHTDSDAEEIKRYAIRVAHDVESFEQHVERMLKNIE